MSLSIIAATPQEVQRRDLRLTTGSEEATPTVDVPRGYALIIGVSNYKNLDASMQLRYPESDAEAIYRVLISREAGAFPAENVHFLKGTQATLANVRDQLENWLPSVAKPSDRVLVYFAGHGFVKNGKGYLATWDVDPELPETTAYSMSSLGEVLARRVKARWKVLLTDACHSGKINRETTDEKVDAEFRNLPGDFLTLTATTEREKSYEDPELSTGFGLFTYFLVQAWKGVADNDPCDGKLTADELIEYVRTNVRRYAKDRGVSQTPTPLGDYEPDMPLGVSRSCLTTNNSSPAPSMFGSAVIESNMDEVSVYMDGVLIGESHKSKPLIMPGLSSGLHKFEGVKAGYEPDRKEIMIAPGQQSTISMRIRYAKQIKKPALALNEEGEKLLFTRRSTVNPLNIAPVARKQNEGDLRKAGEMFDRALKEDPSYAVPAFRLGQVNQLLSDNEASLNAYRRAIQIDPNYVDARLQYAAVLIENGDPDEAIRQLNEATRLEPSNDEAIALTARAYWEKAAWSNAVTTADKAIALKLSNDQAHLWKADALRQLAAAEKDRNRQKTLYSSAREEYKVFLSLTNYSTPPLEWAAFHFIGFGLGSRRHADRQSTYDNQRLAGFLGMCLCEQKLGNLLRAREYCDRALKYDSRDPIARFVSGNVYRDLFNSTDRCDYLISARENYAKMVSLNEDIAEARNARSYLEQIDSILPALKSKGACSSLRF